MNPLPPLPFPRSYWVIPGQFLAGFFPGDLSPDVQTAKLQGLLNLGCSKVINLMQHNEKDHSGKPFQSYAEEMATLSSAGGRQVDLIRFEIPDLGLPAASDLTQLLIQIDQWLDEGQVVYLHCWGGRGRTGTVVGSWLARHGETVPLERLRTLTAHAPQFFPAIPETIAQRQWVSTWEVGQ